jgi:hypothetical protein
MTENKPSRFQFKEIFPVLFRPRSAFARLTEKSASAWLTPMLVLSLMLILRLAVQGYFQAQAAMMGEVPLPPDWQWWTPEMQNQYMQAQSLTQGPVFVYVIPITMGLAGLWAGWGIFSGLLHLTSTLLGGRGSMNSALNVVAWGSLPFAVRDLLRVIFMLIVQHPINSAGLSGFVTVSEGATIFFSQLFTFVDLFLIWHIVLLIIGISVSDNVSTRKAIGGVIAIILLSLITQAGIGYGSSSLSGLMVSRPF